MALEKEESGFFDAEEQILESGELMYDRVYTSEQFCSYFSLFVGNGVFVSPENQLMVSAGEMEGVVGRNIVIETGWAFINGMFYHNKEIGTLDILPNMTNEPRKDGVFCRYSKTTRSINIFIEEGRIEPKRLDYEWELLLATIDVAPLTQSITNANITDMRPNENVCGFVKGLVDVIETNQLFQQFQAQFGEWFTNLQEFFGNDALGTVMSKLQELESGKAELDDFENLVKIVEGKYDKPVVHNNILSVAGWSGSTVPYSYTINLEGVKTNSIVEVGLRNSANIDQIREWGYANILGYSQSNGSIVLRCWGMKPTIDLPVTIIVGGGL